MANHFLNAPIVYRVGTACIKYVPKFISYAFARFIADISRLIYWPASRKIATNLTRVFPDASDHEISHRTKKVFKNYAEYLVDYGRFSGLDKETLLKKIVRFKGEDNLIEALNLKKGLILLTAHLGNWELGGMFFSAYGLKVNVLTLPDENDDIDANRRAYRDKYGIKTITVGDSPLSSIEMVNALNNNEVLAMLIDRYSEEKDSIELDFFNKPTLFPKGPLILSRITGAPIVVAFVVKEDGEYIGVVEKPFVVENAEEEQGFLNKIVSFFEHYVVKYANQWYDFR